MTAESSELRVLDDATREAAIGHVEAAKARGWESLHLRAWFSERGVELSEYLAARRGHGVSEAAFNTLVMVSITGLPEHPPGHEPADDFPDLPARMKAARRWLLWKSIPNQDPTKKPRKVPFYASGRERGLTDGGRVALDSAEDVAQLVDYAAACALLSSGAYAGLGFALGPDGEGCWQGIDLDNLADHPGLTFIVEDGLPGYLEKSPSGLGIHAVGYGRSFRSLGSNATGIEAYAGGRYFTVTGESAGRGDIEDLAEFVERRLAPLHTPQPQDTSRASDPGSIEGALAAHDLRSALTAIRADDYHVWIRMGLALKGLADVGRSLWLEWSQTSSKYDPAAAARAWDSFNPTDISYKSVFAEAQACGWANPSSGGAAQQHAAAPSAPAAGDDVFEVLSIADLRSMPDAQWLIKDAIPADGLVFIYGPPATFKSFVCYDLALSYAYEAPSWLGRERKASGGVLYLASEGIHGAKNRIEAWQRENGVGDDTTRFHLIRKTINFLSPEDRARLVRTVGRHIELHGPVSLIFVDTVSRVLPGADENLQKDMTVFVGACDALREFGATVVGVHHTNKNGDMRGSTVFLGQGDAIFRVERDEGAKAGVLTCEKLKDAEDGWKRAFEVREQAWTPAGRIEPVGSLVAVFGGEPKAQDGADDWPPRSICQAILKDIQGAWDKGKPWSPYARARTEGRFAVANISQRYETPAAVAQMMVETWLRNDVLSFDTFNTDTKSKGLRVLQWLD